MKKVILTLTLFVVLCFTANNASAKGIIFYSNGEKAEIATKLPDHAIINDEHVNIGVMYKQFSIFWVPIWNYGETKHVLINDKKDTYYDLDDETIEILKEDFNVELPQKASIGFWNKIGGKLIWCLVIAVAIAGYWITRKDDTQERIPEEMA
ncbi:MAG: hypothetical protein FWC10_08010 [Lentimicrobiaceae bacterium]|nr:hypothetical protein [Lentimicrobiaceae bacterium]